MQNFSPTSMRDFARRFRTARRLLFSCPKVAPHLFVLGASLACCPSGSDCPKRSDRPSRNDVALPPAAPLASPDDEKARSKQEMKRGIPAAPVPWAALPARETTLKRVTFGSCASQYQRQDIWSVVAQNDPDLFLHLGDMIYADVLPDGAAIPADLDVVEKARVDYALLGSQRSFRSFAAQVPMMLVWDDHDYGKNDAGADFARREEMEELFLQFVLAPPEDERRTRPGVYDARIFGPPGRSVQIVLLDTRSFRSPLLPDQRSDEEKRRLKIVGAYLPQRDPKATLLGPAQWQWLEAQLKKPAQVRLIASSIQVIAGEKGIESWGNFPLERERLYALIASTGASGVVLLSGDVHFAEISRTDDGPYPLYDITSSNLAQKVTRWGEPFVNSYRTKGPLFARNFGVVEFAWEAASPKVVLSAVDDEGKVAFRQQVDLDELQAATPH